MHVLGINAYHGNASAALLRDGELVAAVEEERFNRVKYAAGFPGRAVAYCLEEAGIGLSDVDHVAVARDPWARLPRKLMYAARMPSFARDRISALAKFADLKVELAASQGVDVGAVKAKVHRVEHHRAHLASTFFVSPFDRSVGLSADGLGDFGSTMWGMGEGNSLRILGSVAFPHSLGLYYTAITQFLGFERYGEEFKVMGLAAYGEPRFGAEFQRILQTSRRPGFRLGLEYFQHQSKGPSMTWKDSGVTPEIGRLFGPLLEERLGPARHRHDSLGQVHKDVAASLQERLEEVLFQLLNRIHARAECPNLCLAGGVAFNCVANGKIFERTPFENVYVQPAAGDAGLAVGAAFHVRHAILGLPRTFTMRHAYWGPGFDEGRIEEALRPLGMQVQRLGAQLVPTVADLIADGKIVGWFQGRMEWGPRALGNRSILVDPRRQEMKEELNRRVKHRESFRPFAPSVAVEAVGDFFEESHPSPFMTMAYRVRPERVGDIPAPTHEDGTGRLQTVSREENPEYWRLINAFGERTGVPVLLNTSFNDNEPIVCTPEDAVACFRNTSVDALGIGPFLVEKPQGS